MSTDWPKVEKFLSEDEIVEVLFDRMKDADGADSFARSEPGMYHHGLGTAVRNEFWLWHPENPHTMKDYVPELRDGTDYSPRHADNTSGRILEKLHARIIAYRGALMGETMTRQELREEGTQHEANLTKQMIMAVVDELKRSVDRGRHRWRISTTVYREGRRCYQSVTYRRMR